MQVVYKNEDEGSSSRRADSVGIVIYIVRISGYLEEKHVGRSRGRIIEIQDSWRIFGRYKEGVWGRK